jgi:hypothetical protein
MKVKKANRLMSIIDEIWVDTSTKSRYLINDWYLGQIFSKFKFQTPLFSHHTEY